MADPDEEFAFTIAVADFDVSLLPAHARTPGTDAFREAVSRTLQEDFKDFGGKARIIVDQEVIHVTWRPGPTQQDPMDVVTRKLHRGEYPDAIRMLQLLRQIRPDSLDVLYNLGMALSDVGQLEEAEACLRQAIALAPDHTNSMVALGVALARQGRYGDAVTVLQKAVGVDPENPWAHRNLGACLLQTGKAAEAESHLRHAVDLKPDDQQNVFGLAQALFAAGNTEEADEYYIRTIELDSRTPVADAAREARSKLANESFRSRATGGLRLDAVMYLLGALEKFEKSSREDIQKIALEIAVLGQRGLDTNSSSQKYELRSLPGHFSGLHLVCLMYAAFQIIAPNQSVGFDLSKEYESAQALHRKRQGPEKE